MYKKRQEDGYAMSTTWYLLRGWYLLTFIYQSGFFRQLKFFKQNLRGKHLEVPVGNGFVLQWEMFLAGKKKEYEINGVDISTNMITLARKRFLGSQRVKCLQASVEELPYETGSIESVNIVNGFHCFPDPEKAVQEIARVCAPGATVRANVLLHPRKFLRPFVQRVIRYSIKKGDLNRTFDPAETAKLYESYGFNVLQASIEGNTLYLEAQRTSETSRAKPSSSQRTAY